jgi:hypothetical protein
VTSKIKTTKTIWTLPARQCVPCNLHVGTCRQCLEFFPLLRTLYCNTFRTLRCRNRRDERIFYYQPLGLLVVRPKQRLDVSGVSKGGIALPHGTWSLRKKMSDAELRQSSTLTYRLLKRLNLYFPRLTS